MVGSVNGRGNGYVVPNVNIINQQPPSSFYGQQSPLFAANSDSYSVQQQAEEKPGFLSMAGATLKGVLDMPGKIVKDIADHPIAFAATVGLTLAFPGVGIPLALGAGLLFGGKNIVEGGGQLIEGWANGDLDQIRSASATMAEGAVAFVPALKGTRTFMRGQVAKNAASVGAAEGKVTIGGKTAKGGENIEGVTYKAGQNIGGRTVNANEIGYGDAVRLLGRQYKYGAAKAGDLVKAQPQAIREAGGIAGYASKAKTAAAEALGEGGVVRTNMRSNAEAVGKYIHEKSTPAAKTPANAVEAPAAEVASPASGTAKADAFAAKKLYSKTEKVATPETASPASATSNPEAFSASVWKKAPAAEVASPANATKSTKNPFGADESSFVESASPVTAKFGRKELIELNKLDKLHNPTRRQKARLLELRALRNAEPKQA
jgi:hypothetical protein